ncbi:MAG: YwbE family protein [Methanobacterium sp.]|nr:YwbE family protein [Methanobacterium sp.]
MNGKYRKDISPQTEVYIVLKKDQRSGKLTRGTVKDILTNSSFHPHGIKVKLNDGRIGRVKQIIKK